MSDPVAEINAGFYDRLGAAIYSYRTGSGTALYSGTLPVFNTLAIQETPAPYIVFQRLTGNDAYSFGNDKERSFDVMVKVLSLRSYPTQESEPIYAQAHEHIQDAVFAMTGWKVQRVRRYSSIESYRDDAGYWHTGGVYRLDIATT